MIKKILKATVLDKSKIVLLLGGYVVFTELIKSGAEVYLLEQSLEVKLVLFSLAIMILYKMSALIKIIAIVIAISLILSIFVLQTGFVVYVFVFYAFLGMLKSVRRQAFHE